MTPHTRTETVLPDIQVAAAEPSARMKILQFLHVTDRDPLYINRPIRSALNIEPSDIDSAIASLLDDGLITLFERPAGVPLIDEFDEGDAFKLDVIRPTRKGHDAMIDMWPDGQLPVAEEPRLVIGCFAGEFSCPVRLAVPVTDLGGRFPEDSPIGRNVAMGHPYDAWELHRLSTGKDDRLLMRSRAIPARIEADPKIRHLDKLPTYRGWMSVDPEGDCTENRRDLAELVFLIAMGAG